MNNELSIYKQNRIKELNKNFTSSLMRLNSNLANAIRAIQLSRSRNKLQFINNLIQKYNYDLSLLKKNLDNSIKIINSFKPEFNIVKANKKKALLIGINYNGTSYELSGCIDDANRMKDLLTQHGFNEISMFTDNTTIKPTKENILNGLKNIIKNAEAGDILFFYFSGHGSYTYDKNADETDGRDEMIISLELQGILDDEIKTILINNMKREVTIVGLFDSCHSGTILDLKYNYLDSNNYDKYTENDKTSECNGNVIMISGCMDLQTSAEAFIDNKIQGAMSWSFIHCLNEKPETSWRDLIKSMRNLLKSNSFSQIPQLSTDSFYDIDSKIFI
jgi:hypothetical protein